MWKEFNPHLTYTWEFREIDGQVVFIREGQTDPSPDLIDFDREVDISIQEESETNSNWIPLRIKKITQFTVTSINELLKDNKDLILNHPNTTVFMPNYFLRQ